MEEPKKPGVSKSVTYKFTGSASLYIVVSNNEYGQINGLFVNTTSSGHTLHGVCNVLGRVIGIAIQNDKATLLQIIQTLEGVKSESAWVNDMVGKVDSIPSAIAAVLEHFLIDEQHYEYHEAEIQDEGVNSCDNGTRTTIGGNTLHGISLDF